MREDNDCKVHSTWRADRIPMTFPPAARILTAGVPFEIPLPQVPRLLTQSDRF